MADALEAFEENMDEAQERPFNYTYFRRLMGYMRPYGRELAGVLTLIVFGTIATLLEPFVMAIIIDRGVVDKNVALVFGLAGGLVVLRLLAWASGRLRMSRIVGISQSVLFDLRKQLFEHIQRLSLRFYDSRPVGRIMSRVTSDVGAINEMLNGGVTTFLVEGLSLVGIIVIMLAINWKLALAAFCIVPTFYPIFGKLRGRVEATWKNVRKSASNMNGLLNESVNGVRVTQSFSREERNIARFERMNQSNRDINVQAIRYDNLLWPIVELVGMAGTAALIYVGAIQVASGAMSLGVILAFVNYLWRFWGPVSALSRVWSQVLSAMASAERIFEFLDTAPDIADAPDARQMPQIRGAVSFESVSFSYDQADPEAKRALRNVSLDVAPGQTVAVVGPTGAGKTSLINLMMRFYDPTEGTVRIDGHDLRNMALATVRQQIALVLQEPFIFSGTLDENIRYGRLDATRAEVEAAASAVGLDGFVRTLKEGYDFKVEERGARLSQGQRQLVSFARALLADPRILILDEATSSVDTVTERAIQAALRVLLKGRTAFIIAHRLSTVRDADLIVVMRDGEIAEQGRHDDLLAGRGLYWQLLHAHEASRASSPSQPPMLRPERLAVSPN